MTKKALIVSPYLDHLGGGERYMLASASALEELGYEIFFSWDNLDEIKNLSEMLGITLTAPGLDPKIKQLYHSRNPLSMYLSTRHYDLVLYLSDGSIPLLGAKRNLVHMQVPFHGVGGRSLKNTFKKSFIHQIVVNSKFTKHVIDQEFGLGSVVLYPPVPLLNQGKSKDQLILSVGRFEPSLNAKHQDVLIEAFKQLSPHLPTWRLVLAGGCSAQGWLAQLQKQAEGYNIDFAPNVSHADLTSLYQRAKIYWHAAGFGVDESKNPELTEHFGISTVEALSAGCIPLVVPGGGQREILPDDQYHWHSTPELVAKTLAQIKTPVSPDVHIDQYSLSAFKTKLSSLIL